MILSKRTLLVMLALALTLISQIRCGSPSVRSEGRTRQASTEEVAVESIKALIGNPKDESALKGIRGLEPGLYLRLLKLAADSPGPAAYCAVATLVVNAMKDSPNSRTGKLYTNARRESLDSEIDRLYEECIAKQAEWQKDRTLFRNHTRALLVRVNYCADLLTLLEYKSDKSDAILVRIAEVLAIETDPHPISLYGCLAQCKVYFRRGAELDRQRRQIAELCLESLDKARAEPEMAEKLKECDEEKLRSDFESLAQ